MLALSIRQPWAWLILNAGKDIENRNWATKVRGRVLIHAAKGMTQAEWAAAVNFARNYCKVPVEKMWEGVQYGALERGGIVGSVEIVDCVSKSGSAWFVGDYGFVLRNPKPGPFVPYRGQLGFFDIPASALGADYVA